MSEIGDTLRALIAEREEELERLWKALEVIEPKTPEREPEPEVHTHTTDASLVVDTEQDRNPLALAKPHPHEPTGRYMNRTRDVWADAYHYSRVRGWSAFSASDIYGHIDRATEKVIVSSLSRMAYDVRVLTPVAKARGVYTIPPRFRRDNDEADMSYNEAYAASRKHD